jgi:hypothetical protein
MTVVASNVSAHATRESLLADRVRRLTDLAYGLSMGGAIGSVLGLVTLIYPGNALGPIIGGMAGVLIGGIASQVRRRP